MENSVIIAAKLDRIACNYRNEMEFAIDNLNRELENNLIELVEKFGTKAVQAAADEIEDNLGIDLEPQTSLQEAFDCVPESESNEESEDA
jgi:hypothetical protein